MEKAKTYFALGFGIVIGWIAHSILGGGLFRLLFLAVLIWIALIVINARQDTPETTKD